MVLTVTLGVDGKLLLKVLLYRLWMTVPLITPHSIYWKQQKILKW